MATGPRHKRLYKDSPKLERGDDGNMKSVKPSEKEAVKTQSGIDDVKMDDAEPADEARVQELKDMHKRHETEMTAYHKRHQKEAAKQSDGGENQIEEVKKDEKITD